VIRMFGVTNGAGEI